MTTLIGVRLATYYQLLGVPPRPSGVDPDRYTATVKAAYRREVRRWHEANATPQLSRDMWPVVNRARDVLMNPHERTRYDATLAQGRGRVAIPDGAKLPELERF
jgi:curved DNA-binding protein CbpA